MERNDGIEVDEDRTFFERLERLAAERAGASDAIHQTGAVSPGSQNDSGGCTADKEGAGGAGVGKPEPKARRMDPKGGWLPGPGLAVDSAFGTRPERKVRRLGLRLKQSQYSLLEGAAELYGVRPTTMARMLINRGAEAVVRSYLRDESDLKGSAEFD